MYAIRSYYANDYSATANANYLSAPSAAGSTGAKVVYASNGANVNVTGLSENTQYFFNRITSYNVCYTKLLRYYKKIL